MDGIESGGWQLDRTADGLTIAESDAFALRCFDIISDVKNTLMLEARNRHGK